MLVAGHDGRDNVHNGESSQKPTKPNLKEESEAAFLKKSLGRMLNESVANFELTVNGMIRSRDFPAFLSKFESDHNVDICCEVAEGHIRAFASRTMDMPMHPDTILEIICKFPKMRERMHNALTPLSTRINGGGIKAIREEFETSMRMSRMYTDGDDDDNDDDDQENHRSIRPTSNNVLDNLPMTPAAAQYQKRLLREKTMQYRRRMMLGSEEEGDDNNNNNENTKSAQNTSFEASNKSFLEQYIEQNKSLSYNNPPHFTPGNRSVMPGTFPFSPFQSQQQQQSSSITNTMTSDLAGPNKSFTNTTNTSFQQPSPSPSPPRDSSLIHQQQQSSSSQPISFIPTTTSLLPTQGPKSILKNTTHHSTSYQQSHMDVDEVNNGPLHGVEDISRIQHLEADQSGIGMEEPSGIVPFASSQMGRDPSPLLSSSPVPKSSARKRVSSSSSQTDSPSRQHSSSQIMQQSHTLNNNTTTSTTPSNSATTTATSSKVTNDDKWMHLLSEKSKQISNLEHRLESETRINEERLLEIQESFETIKRELTSKKKQVVELLADEQDKTKCITDLEAKLANLQSELDATKESEKKLLTNVLDKDGRLEELELHQKEQIEELETLTKAIHDYQVGLRNVVAERDGYVEKIKEMEEALTMMKEFADECENLHKENEELRGKITQLQNELEVLEREASVAAANANAVEDKSVMVDTNDLSLDEAVPATVPQPATAFLSPRREQDKDAIISRLEMEKQQAIFELDNEIHAHQETAQQFLEDESRLQERIQILQNEVETLRERLLESAMTSQQLSLQMPPSVMTCSVGSQTNPLSEWMRAVEVQVEREAMVDLAVQTDDNAQTREEELNYIALLRADYDQKRMELADALAAVDEATNTISSLKARLQDREATIDQINHVNDDLLDIRIESGSTVFVEDVEGEVKQLEESLAHSLATVHKTKSLLQSSLDRLRERIHMDKMNATLTDSSAQSEYRQMVMLLDRDFMQLESTMERASTMVSNQAKENGMLKGKVSELEMMLERLAQQYRRSLAANGNVDAMDVDSEFGGLNRKDSETTLSDDLDDEKALGRKSRATDVDADLAWSDDEDEVAARQQSKTIIIAPAPTSSVIASVGWTFAKLTFWIFYTCFAVFIGALLLSSFNEHILRTMRGQSAGNNESMWVDLNNGGFSYGAIKIEGVDVLNRAVEGVVRWFMGSVFADGGELVVAEMPY